MVYTKNFQQHNDPFPAIHSFYAKQIVYTPRLVKVFPDAPRFSAHKSAVVEGSLDIAPSFI